MIKSFKDKDTQAVFEKRSVKSFPPDLLKRAFIKLHMLHVSVSLGDLRVPPANRLEALSGDRKGQHSIRINDKYRICFVWNEGNTEQVEIVDYH